MVGFSRLLLLSAMVLPIASLPAKGQDAPVIEDRPRLIPNTFGPADELRGFAFSPDSRQLYAAGFGKVVNTWDLRVQKNGPIVPTFTGDLRWSVSRNDRGRINFNSLVAPSRGDMLAMAGSNAMGPEGNIVLYNTATREIDRTLAGHERQIVSLNFSPNGQQLVSVDATGRVLVWNSAANWTAQELRGGDLQDVQHQPAIFLDDHTIAASESLEPQRVSESGNRWQIVLYEIGNPGIKKLSALTAAHQNGIRAIVRGDGNVWASADEAGRIYVGRGRSEPRLLRFQQRSPLSLAFGPRGTLAITNSRLYDRKLIGASVLELWDTNAPDAKSPIFQTALGKEQDSYAMAISPDRTLLATHDADTNEVLVFQIADTADSLRPEPLANPVRISGRGQRVHRVCFRATAEPNDYQLGISYGREDEIKKLFRLNPPNEEESPGFSAAGAIPPKEWRGPDASAGSWSIQSWLNDRSGSDDRSGFTLTERGGQSETVALAAEQGYFGCHCFLPDQDGKPFAVAIGTRLMNGIFVYSLPGPQQPSRLLRYFRDHSGHITSLSCSPNGQFLASGSEDQTVKIWALSGLSGGTPVAQAWGAEFEVRGTQLVVGASLNQAGIAFARGMRRGDVVKSISSYRGGKEQKTDTASDLLKLIKDTPVYHQQVWILERAGKLVPNSADSEGMGRRPIVAGWEPLLTLYADRYNEWALFTPEGYFDSSVADGGDLFGWQINRRQKNPTWAEVTPRFLKGANLQKEMEKPDVIRRVLERGNVFDALQAANEPVPDDVQEHISTIISGVPRIRLMSPLAGDAIASGTPVQIEARVIYPPGQRPQNYDVRATATFRYLGDPVRKPDPATGGEILTWTATSHSHAEWFRVSIHELGKGTACLFNEDSVFVRAAPDAPASKSSPFMLHVLGISSEKYAGGYLPELDYSQDDVDAVIQSLREKQNDFYQMGTVIKLQEETVTLANLQTAIRTLQTEVDRIEQSSSTQQMLLVYVAGHGQIIDGLYHYFPISVESGNNRTRIEQGAISWDLLNELTDTGAQTIFMLDTCEAGTVASQCRPLAQRGGIVMTAASGTSISVEDPKYRHGVFSWSFLQGLDGHAEADSGEEASKGSTRSVSTEGYRGAETGVKRDRIVTMNELFQFIVNDVPRLTHSSTIGSQTPCYTPKPDIYPDLFSQELVRIKPMQSSVVSPK